MLLMDEKKAAIVLDSIEQLKYDFATSVGSATDGAAVMMGCHAGVSTRIRKKWRVGKGFVQVHCGAHKFSLCLDDAVKGDPKSRALDRLMARSFHFQKRRPGWIRKIKVAFAASKKKADKNVENFITLKKKSDTRWVFESRTHAKLLLHPVSILSCFRNLNEL